MSEDKGTRSCAGIVMGLLITALFAACFLFVLIAAAKK